MMKNQRINLSDISVQYPKVFAEYKSQVLISADVEVQIKDPMSLFLVWLRSKNCRFKVCHNVFEDMWYYDAWQHYRSRSPVRHQGLNRESYDHAFNDALNAILQTYEFQLNGKEKE